MSSRWPATRARWVLAALADTREVALRRAKALALETIAGLAELGEADIDDTIHFDAA